MDAEAQRAIDNGQYVNWIQKYIETALVPAGEWIDIRHNMKRHVVVFVYTEEGNLLWPTMIHTDRNSFSFTLGHPTAYQCEDGSIEVDWQDATEDVRVTVVVEG